MDLTLDRRDGLPEALRTLLHHFPRTEWPDHPNFAGLAAFWMQRHLMFRQMGDRLTADALETVDAQMDPGQFADRVRRIGGQLVGTLHDHHMIEDMQYFPTMQKMEPALARGFEMLDGDHHALDHWLRDFTDAAKAVIATPGTEAAGRFHDCMTGFTPLLERHLTDEEDLVVPLILKTGLR